MAEPVSRRSEELLVTTSRLRAPTGHGQILIVPALDQVGRLLERNRVHSQSCPITSDDLTFADWRGLARRELSAISQSYHASADEREPALTGEAWLVAGHQPEFFHPGVWFKNFALHHLAQRLGATALNLVIDTDTAKSSHLYLPAGERLAQLPFDRTAPALPYEERAVDDKAMFASVPERFAAIAQTWGFEPMLAEFWREMPTTLLLGERFSHARRRVEQRWGVAQAEAPMSQVCQTEAFARFALAILTRLPEFYASYNETVQTYRLAHGIRSRNHPVPNLTRDGDWLEAPFWVWQAGANRRGRLLVKQAADALHLRIGNEPRQIVPVRDGATAWRALESQGVKIRSRALTTTMFLRLFVADVFLHGIGGGIYDALTDDIIRRFFGVFPPDYLIVSATLNLPLPRFPDAAERCRTLHRRSRDLIYQPERMLVDNALASEKRQWIERITATHTERAARFSRLRELNTAMQPFLWQRIHETNAAIKAAEAESHAHAIASRRDYAFCLYPEAMLRSFFMHGEWRGGR